MPRRIAPIRCVNVGTPVLFGGERLDRLRIAAAPAFYSCGLALFALLLGASGLQNAIAEGDTRTISMHHMHTSEDITITFKRDGRYDEAALEKISWFLRDWRKEQQTRMDPHLIDLVWEVQRESGSKEPIWVVCGYRSPETNAMLRRHSNGVARFSQHILGHAMDFYIPGVPLDQLRAIGLRLQRGGVGFYPTSGSPFVHMDTGGIRHWPRMTREQLVRVFPDGRTVHIPTDGKPLPGYALALADIKKRGDSPSDTSLEAARSAGFDVADEGVGHRIARPFAKLFGLGKTDEDDEGDAPAATASIAEPPRTGAKAVLAAAIARTGDKLAAEKRRLADAASRAEDKLAAGKAKLARVASNAEDKLSAEKAKLIKIASKARGIARAEASTATPNQIIESRGFWQGLPDGDAIRSVAAAAAKSVAALARLDAGKRNRQQRPGNNRVDSAILYPAAGSHRAGRRSRVCRVSGRRICGSPVGYGRYRPGGAKGDGNRSPCRPDRRRRNDHCGKARQRPADLGHSHGREKDVVDHPRQHRAARRSLATGRRVVAECPPLPIRHRARCA